MLRRSTLVTQHTLTISLSLLFLLSFAALPAHADYIHQLYYNNVQWVDQDLTALTGASLPNSSTGIAAFYTTPNHQFHILLRNHRSTCPPTLLQKHELERRGSDRLYGRPHICRRGRNLRICYRQPAACLLPWKRPARSPALLQQRELGRRGHHGSRRWSIDRLQLVGSLCHCSE